MFIFLLSLTIPHRSERVNKSSSWRISVNNELGSIYKETVVRELYGFPEFDWKNRENAKILKIADFRSEN
jgi:hypothetical protein